MRFYEQFVRCAPFTLVFITVVITGLVVMTIMLAPPPDLEDPLKGAEARGTPIKGATAALSNLLTGNLTPVPSVEVDVDLYQQSFVFQYILAYDLMGDCPNGVCLTENPLDDGGQQCNDLSGPEMFSLTFTSSAMASLYTVEALTSMCQFAESLEDLDLINDHCPIHSVGHHVAHIAQTTCQMLTQDDLDSALEVIESCVPFVFNNTHLECVKRGCPTPPPHCSNSSSAHQILMYLTDISFTSGAENNTYLEYAQVIIPLNDAIHAPEFYQQVIQKKYDTALLALVGADPAVKLDLYSRYMKIDLSLFAAGLLLILILTYMYTRSMILTVALVIDVALSYSLAYFFYFMVFQITFFPFMNLLAGLLVIAVAADDLYLFHDMWEQHKNHETDVNLSHILQKTFTHASLSIFTTSFTTAAALFANVFNHITIIKCFAIFCGTAILCNCIIVLTFVPAAVLVHERMTRNCCMRTQPECCTTLTNFVRGMNDKIFRELLPYLVNELYFVWLMLFALVGAGGIVAVYYYPGLNLPTSPVNQLLSTDQPPEHYDMYLKEKFQYEKLHDTTLSSHGLPLFFIWGLEPKDVGNPFNPEDNGTLIFDQSFNLSRVESQTFMLSFCEHLKNQSFMFSKEQPCTMEIFNTYMTMSCTDSSLEPCCNQPSHPFPPDLFMTCFPQFMKALYTVIPRHILLGVPYFDENDDMVAYLISCQSTQELVFLYDEMDKFYTKINEFIDVENSKAPAGVDSAFVTTNFLFYDIQLSLLTGTYMAFGVSITIALTVLLIITRNVLTTIYSMATITLAIFVTVGTLALAGWELNVLESIILSISVGLSIDFAIHYSVAYILSAKPNREARITETFSRVGSPVAMAASTTFLAGLPCLAARVRGYQQLGEFLLVVMVVSWFYATFFFKSIGRFIGPLGRTGFIPLPWQLYQQCKDSDNAVHSNSNNQYALKEDVDPDVDPDVTFNGKVVHVPATPCNGDVHYECKDKDEEERNEDEDDDENERDVFLTLI